MTKLIKTVDKTGDAILNWIANSMGTNLCIVLFTLIAVVPLYYQLPDNILSWQQWLSQTAIQLIALAILAKVSKIEGGKQGRLIQDTHDIVMKEIKLLMEGHKELKKLTKELCGVK